VTSLFSDNCHQTAITGFRNRRCVVRLSIRFPRCAGDDPVTLRLAILTIRWKNDSLLSLSILNRVGPLSRRAERTEVSLSLSHSFRKFLGLQVFPFSKPVQMPEGSKGQNDRRQMSRSSTKSKSCQLHSYPIAIVSRNTTFRWHKNYAPCRHLKCPQPENCRSKFGCSQDRLPCCSSPGAVLKARLRCLPVFANDST